LHSDRGERDDIVLVRFRLLEPPEFGDLVVLHYGRSDAGIRSFVCSDIDVFDRWVVPDNEPGSRVSSDRRVLGHDLQRPWGSDGLYIGDEQRIVFQRWRRGTGIDVRGGQHRHRVIAFSAHLKRGGAMRYALMLVSLGGCADKGSVDDLRRENAALKLRVEKLESQLGSNSSPATGDRPAQAKHQDSTNEMATTVLSAVDRHIGDLHREGLKYEAFLDEHGGIRDLGLVATKLRERVVEQNGSEEGAWRGLSNWLGLRAAAAIMSGKVTGSSGEDRPDAKTHLAAMEQDLLGENPAIVASNLGFKLSESIDERGHLRDPSAICRRIRDWHFKRGENGHGALLSSYGRVVGTEIWTGWLCDQPK
jgi:hypothetical protein